MDSFIYVMEALVLSFETVVFGIVMVGRTIVRRNRNATEKEVSLSRRMIPDPCQESRTRRVR